MVIDSGYLSALHRPNFDLNYDGIADFFEGGIITKKGDRLNFDVIIFATGFVTGDFPLPVSGINGKSIYEYHKEQGGPMAYLGTATPGFPNFYMISGPNTTTGHASVIFTTEVQVNYSIQLIKPIVQRLATSINVTSTATDAYNNAIQKKLTASVWSSNCTSWYRKGPEGKITTVFPGTAIEFWWRLRNLNWGDFEVVGGEKWARRRKIVKVLKSLCFATLVMFSGHAAYNWDQKVASTVWKNAAEQCSRYWKALPSVAHMISGRA